MLTKLSRDRAEFCELVEHPAGGDGGEFPQYHAFYVDENGAHYVTGFPESPTDTFTDEEPEAYTPAETHQEATALLAGWLKDVGVEAPELVEAFRNAPSFDVVFEGLDEEDEDED